MIKTLAPLIILGMLISVSSGDEWLEGEYGISRDHGDIGQYFTDPIFTSPGGHYLSSDPALREMQISLDLPRPSSTAGLVQPSQGVTSNAVYLNTAGRWQIDLADGSSLDLNLYQSRNVVFGKGGLIMHAASSDAFVSGDISGSDLRLNVVPDSGTELYEISIDIRKMPYTGSYALFRVGTDTILGSIRSARWSPVH
jgi:hypothetical protein